MTCCEAIHEVFDAKANGNIEVGELPTWTHVRGQVAWYVYQGPYRDISTKGWDVFWRKFATANLKMEGAPGDVYACSPGCHKEDDQANMLTIFWAPVG
ncbi:MAG TPA: hypothetical protein VEY12_00230 [Thermoplasmata archaeon]|nr:hypothetical protein [Thermoplasmata archaeon]